MRARPQPAPQAGGFLTRRREIAAGTTATSRRSRHRPARRRERQSRHGICTWSASMRPEAVVLRGPPASRHRCPGPLPSGLSPSLLRGARIRKACPAAEDFYARAISLPIYPGLSEGTSRGSSRRSRPSRARYSVGSSMARPQPRRVLFRVDASASIGTGHIVRCVALSRELARRDLQPGSRRDPKRCPTKVAATATRSFARRPSRRRGRSHRGDAPRARRRPFPRS